MRRFVMAVVALGLAVSCMQGQTDAAKRAKVEQLFTVMRLDHSMGQMLTAIQQQTENMVRSSPGYSQMTPQQKQVSRDFQNKVMALAAGSVGWKAMEPEMVALYASTYSEQEIDGLIAFYKSPVGQEMLNKSPELAQKSMQIAQQRAVALQPKLQQILLDYNRALEAAGPAKPGASKSPATTGASH